MAYEVTNKLTGESEVLSENEAEAKHGAVEFTMMVAGMSETHSAVNLSVESDTDGLGDIYEDSECDISEAFA